MPSTSNQNHLFLTRDFPPNKPGGIRSYYLGLLKNFPKDQVSLLTMKATDETKGQVFDNNCNFPVYRAFIEDHWGKSVLNNIIWVFYCLKVISRRKITLLHCGNIRPFGYVAIALHYLINIKYVLYFHGNDALRLYKAMTINKTKRVIFRKVISKASVINVNSLFTKNLVAEKFNIPLDKIIVTNPGIDELYIRAKSNYPKLDKNMGINLITVGRLEDRKGFDVVLRAVSQLREDGFKINYTILGGGDINKFQILAEQLKISKYVTFTGFLDKNEEVVKYVLKSDIFIMPSRYDKKKNDVEGFGIVYIEANALKRPVIAANTGGVSDAVIHDKTGILVNDPQSTEEVAEAIKNMILNRGQTIEMARYAYDRAVQKFSWKQITDQYLANLSQIVRN